MNGRIRPSHKSAYTVRQKKKRARTICTRVNRQRCARDSKMQQLQHPAFEQRVVRGGGSLEQRIAQDRNRVRQGLQGLAEGREQVRLLFRVRGHAERGGECLQWVHRRRHGLLFVVVEDGAGVLRCGSVAVKDA
jgi:hypothetical protein